jgi:prepilin-type N-terminal cleavage/methylation domain-containing protein
MRALVNNKGFTLIEVLAAIVIFSVTLLIFNAYIVNSFSSNKSQNTNQVAINIAREIAEQWKSGNGRVPGSTASTPDIGPMTYQEIKNTYGASLDSVQGATVALHPIQINHTTYTPFVTLKNLGPIISITVTVKSSQDNRILATLYTGIANPKKGEN